MWLLIRKHLQGWVVFFLPSLRHISDGTAAGNLFTPPFTHIKPSACRERHGTGRHGSHDRREGGPSHRQRRQSDRLSVAFTPNPAERRRGRGQGRGGRSASWEGRGDGTSFTTVTFVLNRRKHGGDWTGAASRRGVTRRSRAQR